MRAVSYIPLIVGLPLYLYGYMTMSTEHLMTLIYPLAATGAIATGGLCKWRAKQARRVVRAVISDNVSSLGDVLLCVGLSLSILSIVTGDNPKLSIDLVRPLIVHSRFLLCVSIYTVLIRMALSVGVQIDE